MHVVDDAGEYVGIGIGRHPVAQVEHVPRGRQTPPQLLIHSGAQHRPGSTEQGRVEIALHRRPTDPARRLAEDPVTLEELAAEFGVSRERVRQIEVRAFEKVQDAVKKGALALQPA